MLIVFTWHFIHIHNGHKTGSTIFPFNIFTEGHTGVALFMALSGYLFAKLIENKKIIYRKFLLNRLLRLLPLLLFVMGIEGIIKISNGTSISEYFELIAKGIILPILPKGVWSIVVEFHFYLILPIFLFINRKQKYMLFGVLVLIILFRFVLYLRIGQIQSLSYSTLIGRIDQFILGILAFQFCEYIKKKHFCPYNFHTILIVLLLF